GLSESLSRGLGFGLGAEASFEPEGWRMPGYPIFIAASRFITGYNNIGIVLIQAALFLASVWFVYKVAIRVFGELTGFIFLVFSGVYPFCAFCGGRQAPSMTVVV